MPRGRLLEVSTFCAVAAALLAFLFRDAWLHGHVLGQADYLFEFLPWQPYRPAGWRTHNRLLSDIAVVFYPFLFYAREAVRHGEFPMWISAIGAGQPFFGAFQTALLSPFTLLHYVLPFPASFTADVAARLFAGGLGMYLFLRKLPVGPGAAMFGGVAYLLNPFSVVWLEHPLSAVAACLPWVFLTVDICVRRRDGRGVAAVGAATALTLLTGHPETAFKVLLVAAAYALYRGVVSGHALRALALVAGAMVLGALMSSIQILPFLEYVRESRVLGERQAPGRPLLTSPAAAFVTAFLPDFYGTPLRNRFVLAGTNYNEQQLYPGIVTWLFAALALTHRQHRGRAIFFLIAGAVSVLIMYGTPVARLLAFVLPPLRVAALSRFGLIGITAVIVAGAIGVDALFSRDRSRPPAPWLRQVVVAAAAALVIAAIVGSFLLGQHALLTDSRQWTQTRRGTTTAAQLLALAVVCVVVGARFRREAAAALPLALLSVDLVAFGDGFHALMPRELVFPPVRELAIPQSDRGIFRVAGWRDTLPANTAIVYGLEDVRSYDGLGVRQYSELLDVSFTFTGSTHQLGTAAMPHVLDLLNIKYLLTSPDVELPPGRFTLILEGPTRVYLNQRVQPRAFLADGHVTLQGNEARRAIRDGGRLDLTRVAVLDRPLDRELEPDGAQGDVGAAEMRRYENHAVTIATRANGRRLLVLTDVYYPGWIAMVDGERVPIHRANYAFRAVSVPAGEHIVEFRYRPASVRYGAVGSLGGCLAVVLLCVRKKRGHSTLP
jgi:hypothetical protein